MYMHLFMYIVHCTLCREGEDVSEEGKKINSVVLPWEMKYFSPMLRFRKYLNFFIIDTFNFQIISTFLEAFHIFYYFSSFYPRLCQVLL